ncbi:hypothetical protein [Nocardia cyriacigeorgica]|uniref:hypothetical protein n=1 Tax=Nocardia cyriacigeorgica TaxID=135487 RepID=UPI0013D231B2|nr:hypothetical protein [Nocardia cyriacigeorgica]NEW27281.1 hypothetical protein [Nocardia cyriacigeorgica]
MTHSIDRATGTARRLDVRAMVNARIPFLPEARVYQLDPPFDTEAGPVRHIIIATADYDGVTTYALPCDPLGVVSDWGQTLYSCTDTRDHAEVLRRIGYGEVTE